MDLGCRGAEVEGKPAISCEWSGVSGDRFAKYRLWRADGTRKVVFQTEDRSRRWFNDLEVTPGVMYTYKIEALDHAGNVIGHGGPASVRAPGGDGPA